MILNFTETPTIGKSYTFIQPMALDANFKPFTATLLEHGRMKKTDWRDREQFYGIFEYNGEKRQAEIDYTGWYDGGYRV